MKLSLFDNIIAFTTGKYLDLQGKANIDLNIVM